MPARKSRAKKIRIGNTSYLGTRPYELLKELDFVEYSESSPPETARRLHENELDLGLISASDFAVHGGYVGLDHGLACAEKSQSLFLCARRSIDQLETIYLYDGSSASAVLLRLLLREDWKVTPRLVRVPPDFDLSQLRDTEGMLVLEDKIPSELAAMPIVEDLVTAWDRLTGKPFVFLLWAVRPGVLTLKQHQALHDTLHRCVAAGGQLIENVAEDFGVPKDSYDKFLSPSYAYYLDDNSLAGLNSFYEKAAHYKLLPDTHYQSATFTLLNRRTIRAVKERELHEIADSIVAGRRLGVREAVRLAEFGSLVDLGLAADLVRSKVSTERTVSQLCLIERSVKDTSSVERVIERGVSQGAQQILLLPRSEDLDDIGFFENLIHSIHSKYPVRIEAFTIAQLLRLSKRCECPVSEVVSRLVTAGLDSVSGLGGGMLIDRLIKRRGGEYSAAEWLDAMKWVHRFGAKSWCSLVIGPHDTWEDRLMHLHKLRALQDENPGFRYFHIEGGTEWKDGRVPTELRMRAIMLARLFLDNIGTIQESSFVPADLPGVLSLCFGANEVRIDVSADRANAAQASRTLHVLRDLGMDISDRFYEEANPSEVH